MHRAPAFGRDDGNKGRSAAFFREVQIPPLGLAGTLVHPAQAQALIVFAHGSGSSRFSTRNIQVAEALNRRGMATLLLDLLLPEEEGEQSNVFDIKLLAQRLTQAVRWADDAPDMAALPLGLFGASTGAAAALVAAGVLGERIGAVVSRGGRPDLAGDVLPDVKAPTLLIVGGADFGVIELNQWALQRLEGESAIEIVPGATHLFPEPGALDCVIELAADWFARHLFGKSRQSSKSDASR
jgi:pimeloyl-ACP methyl ester carboxylesterase